MSKRTLSVRPAWPGCVWFVFGCLIALLSGLGTSAASGLADKYKDKLVTLRVPSCGEELKFDVSAKLVSNAMWGDWTKCVGIRIRDAHVEDGKIKIAGQRVHVLYDCGIRQVREVAEGAQASSREGSERSTTEGQQVSIEAELPPRADDAAVMDMMNRLFRLPDEDFSFYGGAHRVGLGVSAPLPIHLPDPDYSDEALKAGLEGTVVLIVVIGPDGRISNAAVSRALGRGLDEKAIAAVKRWRFKPAARCGTPVPVEVNIEMTFKLDDRR
ncbi:MAG TPA: energy transducer TonB [Candidatus Angelobacter sp.]